MRVSSLALVTLPAVHSLTRGALHAPHADGAHRRPASAATRFLPDLKAAGGNDAKEITFYDSNTGNPLFTAPRGRSWEEFVAESRSHGWPSFRDEETNWDYVRVLPDGESVSVDGTHLGHNLPDSKGNRYCINLVSVAGKPKGKGDL
ncbi:hypothetical protein JL720_1575 [Aureococcus anophagefferens]|nr:hypothetical protein JL720_1575 [Aureococcus anophagefferens]